MFNLFGSESKSTTKNTSQGNVNDLSDGSQAVNVMGDGNVVRMLDGGAIDRAFDFATDFSKDVTASNQKSISAAIQSVTESARTEAENIAINGQKYLLYGGFALALVAIVSVFKKGKK